MASNWKISQRFELHGKQEGQAYHGTGSKEWMK
jgi:hypothetical protein